MSITAKRLLRDLRNSEVAYDKAVANTLSRLSDLDIILLESLHTRDLALRALVHYALGSPDTDESAPTGTTCKTGREGK